MPRYTGGADRLKACRMAWAGSMRLFVYDSHRHYGLAQLRSNFGGVADVGTIALRTRDMCAQILC